MLCNEFFIRNRINVTSRCAHHYWRVDVLYTSTVHIYTSMDDLGNWPNRYFYREEPLLTG